MERILAGILALVLFVTLLVIGWARDLPLDTTLGRALLGGVVGALLGWLVFGDLGRAILKESLPKIEPYPEAPKESAQAKAPAAPINPSGVPPPPAAGT